MVEILTGAHAIVHFRGGRLAGSKNVFFLNRYQFICLGKGGWVDQYDLHDLGVPPSEPNHKKLMRGCSDLQLMAWWSHCRLDHPTLEGVPSSVGLSHCATGSGSLWRAGGPTTSSLAGSPQLRPAGHPYHPYNSPAVDQLHNPRTPPSMSVAT